MSVRAGHRRDPHSARETGGAGGGDLAGARAGVQVRVTAVDLPVGQRRRLAEFGLRPGALATVRSSTAGGGRLVGVGTSRIALDRATARRLSVETVDSVETAV